MAYATAGSIVALNRFDPEFGLRSLMWVSSGFFGFPPTSQKHVGRCIGYTSFASWCECMCAGCPAKDWCPSSVYSYLALSIPGIDS